MRRPMLAPAFCAGLLLFSQVACQTHTPKTNSEAVQRQADFAAQAKEQELEQARNETRANDEQPNPEPPPVEDVTRRPAGEAPPDPQRTFSASHMDTGVPFPHLPEGGEIPAVFPSLGIQGIAILRRDRAGYHFVGGPTSAPAQTFVRLETDAPDSTRRGQPSAQADFRKLTSTYDSSCRIEINLVPDHSVPMLVSVYGRWYEGKNRLIDFFLFRPAPETATVEAPEPNWTNFSEIAQWNAYFFEDDFQQWHEERPFSNLRFETKGEKLHLFLTTKDEKWFEVELEEGNQPQILKDEVHHLEIHIRRIIVRKEIHVLIGELFEENSDTSTAKFFALPEPKQ